MARIALDAMGGDFAPRATVAGALLDRHPRSTLTAAVATQTTGLLGLYSAGSDEVVAVTSLLLLGGALGPVFMATQNEMLHCAPHRTDLALAANSGVYNAGIAAGAALGGLLLTHVGVRAAFLAGGLLTAAACTMLLAERLLPKVNATLVADLAAAADAAHAAASTGRLNVEANLRGRADHPLRIGMPDVDEVMSRASNLRESVRKGFHA